MKKMIIAIFLCSYLSIHNTLTMERELQDLKNKLVTLKNSLPPEEFPGSSKKETSLEEQMKDAANKYLKEHGLLTRGKKISSEESATEQSAQLLLSMPHEMWEYTLLQMIPSSIQTSGQFLETLKAINNFIVSNKEFYEAFKNEESFASIRRKFLQSFSSGMVIKDVIPTLKKEKPLFIPVIKEMVANLICMVDIKCKKWVASVNALIDQGLNPNFRLSINNWQTSKRVLKETLLSRALSSDRGDLAANRAFALKLLDKDAHGNDPEVEYIIHITVKNDYGKPHLTQFIKEAVDKGMNPNSTVKTPMSGLGESLLEYAIDNNNIDLAQFLLEHNADPDHEPIRCSKYESYTPFEKAQEMGNQEMIDLLQAYRKDQ
jgi:hypothetical protein